jgi:hypothetical protein
MPCLRVRPAAADRRARRARRARAHVPRRPAARIARVLTRNPFLSIALLALAIRFGLPLAFADTLDSGLTGSAWGLAGAALGPFAALATWIDPFLRRFPDWVDSLATLALGLTPYLGLDAVIRHLHRGRRTSRHL